ncbi:helix-turn-helix domain-containing protein [Streptomyces sp. LARHCF249]
MSRRLRIAPDTVRAWRRRFLEHGLDGLRSVTSVCRPTSGACDCAPDCGKRVSTVPRLSWACHRTVAEGLCAGSRTYSSLIKSAQASHC